MKRFMTPKMQGQLRHVLSGVGMVLVAGGYTSEAMATAGVGLVMAVVGMAWSWFAPEKKP